MTVRATRAAGLVARRSSCGPVWRCVLLVAVACLLAQALGGGSQAYAQQARPTLTDLRRVPDGFPLDLDDICVLEPGYYNAKTRVLPRRTHDFGKAAKTATIEVDYDGFTPEAQEAFQRAVEIWETHVESPVTIRVSAAFVDTLDANTLGSAGPSQFWFATTDDGVQSIYADALVDALVGEHVDETSYEIVAFFNSEANWYFGPPNDPGPILTEIDFTSVVLHELGHGLGFLGSMRVDGGEGSWGGTTTGGTVVPVIYDRFAVDGDGTSLIDTGTYPNPSAALADALTSNNGFFDGDSTDLAAQNSTGPVPPQLYLPSQWQDGSSYSHLDEMTYAFGDPNSLMTPQIDNNEVIHSPGPVMCGIFADMGWPMGPDCLAFLNVEIVAFAVDVPGNETARLTWTETDNADIGRYEVEGRYFDGPFQTVVTIPSQEAGDYDVTIARDDLERLRGGEVGLPVAGTYAFRLRLVRPGGEELLTRTVQTTIELDEPAVVSPVYPNPFAERASVSLTLHSEQRVRVEVYNELGQRVAVLYDQTHPANDPRPITFEANRLRNLASGLYFFRVDGRTFSETRSAVLVR